VKTGRNLPPNLHKTPPQKNNKSLRVDSRMCHFLLLHLLYQDLAVAALHLQVLLRPQSRMCLTQAKMKMIMECTNITLHQPNSLHRHPHNLIKLDCQSLNRRELPKLVLRAPTDPSNLEESIKELNLDGTSREYGTSPSKKENVRKKDTSYAFSNVSPLLPPKSPTLPSDTAPTKSLVYDSRPRAMSSTEVERALIGETNP